MRLVAGIFALVGFVLFCVGAAYWTEDGLDLFHAVGTEDSPKTWVSSGLLIASATVAMLHGQRTRKAGWYLIALALLAMAADDRFMGHERLKEWLYFNVFGADRLRMGIWGDAPLTAYIVGGVASLRWMWTQSLGANVKRLFVAAVALGAAAIVLDVVTTTLWSQTIENLMEIAAETLFLSALVLAHAEPHVQNP